MARLIQIIQNQYPNRSIYLDAGDQFSGGLESSSLVSSGQIVNDFFQNVGLKASAIGNHQFDYGPQYLFPLIKNRNSTNLAANLLTKNFSQIPKRQKSIIYQFQHEIKIGVIGLATTETPLTTAGFAQQKFPMYQFVKYQQIVINQSKYLKQKGVNAIIILGHVGNKCSQSLQYGIWTKSTYQKACPDDQITRLIDSLPQGTVDGILQGHRHKIVHQFYKNVPFMGSIKGGYYFNVMYLTFKKEVQLNLQSHNEDDKTNNRLTDIKIQGPIPVCQKIFNGIERCNELSEQQQNIAGDLVNWNFHGKSVYPHPLINSLFKTKWEPKMAPFLKKIAEIDASISIIHDQQNTLGDLVTDIVHQSIPKTDFVIINEGILRSQWKKGPIDYEDIYEMIPFESTIVTFKIYGSQLKKMLKIIQQGQKGFYQTWNLRQTIKLAKDKKGNQIKQQISVTFNNGSKIIDQIEYIGATVDFLLSGGDDFKHVVGTVYHPKQVKQAGILRSFVQASLAKRYFIKTKGIIDPSHPRLIVLKSY